MPDNLPDIKNNPEPPTEPPKEPPKEEEFKFKSEEEFMEKIKGVIDNALEEKVEKEEEPPVEPPPEGIFKEAPKDWNEAADTIISAYEEKQIAKQEELKARVDKVNQEYDKELEEIRKNNPDLPKKGTEEGNTFEKELASVGLKYKGVTNMNEAYDIYTALHTGGKAEPSSKQTSIASKVSKGGSATAPTGEKKYSRIAGRSMDDLLEEDMEKHGIS